MIFTESKQSPNPPTPGLQWVFPRRFHGVGEKVNQDLLDPDQSQTP